MRPSLKTWPIKTLLVVLLGCTVLSIAFPRIVQFGLDRALAGSGYSSEVEDISLLQLLIGRIAATGIKVTSESRENAVASVEIAMLRVALEWGELFRGTLSVAVLIDKPKAVLHAPPEKQKDKPEEKAPDPTAWQTSVRSFMKTRISEFSVRDGEIHFYPKSHEARLDAFVKELRIEARNLTNRHEKAAFALTAVTVGNGKVHLKASADVMTQPLPSFKANASLTDLHLDGLNPFFEEYAHFEIKRGRFDLFFEMDSTPTHYQGYVKPLLREIKVVDWQNDPKRKSFVEMFWKVLAGTAAELFKNHKEDQLGTKVPFEGKWKKTDVNIYESLLNLLKNAFVKPLSEGFEK